MYLKFLEKDFLKIKDKLSKIKSNGKIICNNDNDNKFFFVPINIDSKNKVEDILKNEFKDINYDITNFVPKKEEKPSIRQQIESILPENLHEYIVTSFDSVGDIAITDIDPMLEKYEKEIAKVILNSSPNILTVVKKSGIHGGTFRIQKHTHLLGKKKKKTLVKENGISLSLDIDKTYYSIRMATERKRIFQKIKKGERVLVMFSGIGPYVQSISKNTDANFIYGIEINNEAHKMSVKNKELNKGLNTYLIKGDVNKIIPNFNKNRLTLKLRYDDISNINLEYKSLEVLFNYEDYYKDKDVFENEILTLKKKGVEIYLNPDFVSKGKKIDFKHKRFDQFIIDLKKFIKENNINLILPLNSNINDILLSYLSMNKKLSNLIYYSNNYQGKVVSCKVINQLKPYIKNIVYDIENAEKNYESKSMINSELKLLKNNFNIFYEITNQRNLFCFDLVDLFSIDYNSKEFKEVYNQIVFKQNLKFDRIIMPLPKDAENFLGLTLAISKKGTIIHLYDFLGEDELYKASEKVNNFALINDKKVKIDSVNKCGQYGPKKYRICTDFEFLE